VDVAIVANDGRGRLDGFAGDVDAPSTLPERHVRFGSPLTTSTHNVWSNNDLCAANAGLWHVRPLAEAVAAESSAVSTEPDVDREASSLKENRPEASLFDSVL
jgi:hypothetical protein